MFHQLLFSFLCQAEEKTENVLRQNYKPNTDNTFQAWYLTTSSGLVWQITSATFQRGGHLVLAHLFLSPSFVLLLRNLSAVTVAC